MTVQAQVLRLLKDLQKENDIGLMIITHNLGVVWDICDRAMVMYAGKVVETADVKSSTRTGASLHVGPARLHALARQQA